MEGRTASIRLPPQNVKLFLSSVHADPGRGQVQPAPLRDRDNTRERRVVVDRPLDRTGREVDDRVTRDLALAALFVAILDLALLRRILPEDDDRAVDLGVATPRLDLPPDDDDSVELEAAANAEVALHDEDPLSLPFSVELQVTLGVDDREIVVAGVVRILRRAPVELVLHVAAAVGPERRTRAPGIRTRRNDLLRLGDEVLVVPFPEFDQIFTGDRGVLILGRIPFDRPTA